MKNKDSAPDFFPIAYDVEEGKTYYWCSCGESKTQPLCDRSDCGSKAVAYHAELTETLFFVIANSQKTHLYVMAHMLSYFLII